MVEQFECIWQFCWFAGLAVIEVACGNSPFGRIRDRLLDARMGSLTLRGHFVDGGTGDGRRGRCGREEDPDEFAQ